MRIGFIHGRMKSNEKTEYFIINHSAVYLIKNGHLILCAMNTEYEMGEY